VTAEEPDWHDMLWYGGASLATVKLMLGMWLAEKNCITIMAESMNTVDLAGMSGRNMWRRVMRYQVHDPSRTVRHQQSTLLDRNKVPQLKMRIRMVY
jgi:hypothetical protein